MSEKKVIRIEIEYADGSGERAVGDDAMTIWKAIQGGFVMNHIHGMDYKGPKMVPFEAPPQLNRQRSED